MGMSVSCDGCGLEYAGRRGLGGLFPHRSNLRPAYLRMLGEIVRFHRAARQLLAAATTTATTLGATFATTHRFSDYFRTHFLVPMVSAVWSCAPGTAMDYPARYLFTFLDNHGMLAIRGAPRWRTVVGGSRTYVERIAKGVHDVRLATPVESVRRSERHVQRPDRRRRRGDVRRRDHRHPRRPGVEHPGGADAGPPSGSRRLRVLAQRDDVAHRRATAPPGPPGVGIVELPACRRARPTSRPPG